MKIDGDTRDGTLFAESASHYVGTRRTTRGTFEERKFDGPEWKVKQEWREWRDETVKRETIHVERVRGKSMGTKRRNADRPIAGNTSDGRLYSTGTYKHYVGERRMNNGKFETRQFDMPRAEAIAAWREWRDEVMAKPDVAETEEVVETHEEHKEADVSTKAQQTKTQPARAKQDSMYILSFKANRMQKVVAAFKDMDTALRMAESLTVALDVTGQDGEYDVTDVEVWG